MVSFLKKPVFISVLICIFFFYSGVFNYSPDRKIISLISESDIISITGTLVSSPVKSNNGKTFAGLFKLSETASLHYKSNAIGYIKVLIPTNSVEAFYPGKLYSKSVNKNVTLFESGGIYTFSGKLNNGFFIVSDCTDSFWSKNIFGKIDYFRALCRLQFKRLMYSWGAGGGLLLALLCGAREYTQQDVSEYFRNAGLSHILALSGMHLSMFSSISLFIGEKLKNKKFSYLIKLIILTVFVWFAGFSPSLLRAYICSLLLLFASIVNSEEPDMKIILCFSFLLQCIISPIDIKNAGFILSYGALAGILIFSNFFSEFFTKILPKNLGDSLSASVSAQFFTFPISLKMFGTFSPIGILATTIVSPLITIFIYAGLLLIVLSLIFPSLSSCSGIFVNFLYTVIKYLVFNFSKAPRLIV